MKLPHCAKAIAILIAGALSIHASVGADSHHPGAGRHHGMSKGGQGMRGHHRHHGALHGTQLFGPSWKQTLTQEQTKKINQLHADLAKTKAPLKTRMTLAKVELAVLLTTNDAPDTGAIDQKIREILELKGQILREHSNHVIEMRQMLTPEQRASFDMHVLRKAGRQHKKAH